MWGIGPRCLGVEALFQAAESLFPSPAMVRKPGGVDHVRTARQLFIAKKAVVAPLPCSLRRMGLSIGHDGAKSLPCVIQTQPLFGTENSSTGLVSLRLSPDGSAHE